MAISKMMRTALKALSYTDLDLTKNYELQRKLVNVKKYNPALLLYKMWDHTVRFEDHDIPVRIFTPPEEEGRRLLLFFHGGGWVTGNIDSYSRVCADMARETGRTVVSVDYRLAPEHRFPAAPEDCYRVAREIFLDSSLFCDIPTEDIALIGDSAGANLAAVVSLMARDRGEFLPSRQILLYPATYFDHDPASSPFDSVRENGTDYLLTSKHICEYMALYRSGEADLSSPYFAPLLAGDFSRQPDTLVITAEYDPLRDEGEAYAQKLAQAGNRVVLRRIPDALHGFFSLPVQFSQVRDCYALINAFLKEGEPSEQADASGVETPR